MKQSLLTGRVSKQSRFPSKILEPNRTTTQERTLVGVFLTDDQVEEPISLEIRGRPGVTIVLSADPRQVGELAVENRVTNATGKHGHADLRLVKQNLETHAIVLLVR